MEKMRLPSHLLCTLVAIFFTSGCFAVLRLLLLLTVFNYKYVNECNLFYDQSLFAIQNAFAI